MNLLMWRFRPSSDLYFMSTRLLAFWKRSFRARIKRAVCFGKRERLTGGLLSLLLRGVMKRSLEDIKGQSAAPSTRHFQGIVRSFFGWDDEIKNSRDRVWSSSPQKSAPPPPSSQLLSLKHERLQTDFVPERFPSCSQRLFH